MPPLFLFVIVPKLAGESLGILPIDFWGRMWYNSTERELAPRSEFRKCEQIVNFLLTNPLSALYTKNPNSTDRFLCNM
jgi:hypothetical protein